MDTKVDDLGARPRYQKIDHIAIAVKDLDAAIKFFQNCLGFNLVRRRDIRGAVTGMVSAEMEHNNIKFVLCQGTEPESQVSRLIQQHGSGVAHIALAVENAEDSAHILQKHGLQFDTTVIRGPGLKQIFSRRDLNSGLSFEFIERDASQQEFLEENIQELFSQLEKSSAY
ncbi:VOC family protein [Massilia aurea]|uniref:VOC family protein n=1 Tax=Massilia aurea TaxID=373040 RepID=UPI0021638CB2|nr:VOC family protein [Massilia aurea]MCS0710054.1 VOC family protein [Massilia aurea]